MPTVLVVTEVFENLARSAARARGFGRLRRLVLPHPMEGRSPTEIMQIARERLGDIVTALTRDA